MTDRGRAAAWACRVTAVMALLLGLAGIALREAAPTTWAVPLSTGELLPGWRVEAIQRREAQVHLTLESQALRYGLQIEHRGTSPGPAPLRLAGRYRLLPSPSLAPPADEALDTIVARLSAWEAAWPQPPAFVRPTGNMGTAAQRLQRALLDLVALGGICALIALLPAVLANLRPIRPSTVALLLILIGATGALWLGLGTAGVWHSNQHGFDRVSDLSFGRPPWVSSLSLIHGYGFYTVMAPLVGGGPDGGRDVLWTAGLLTLATLPLWFAAFKTALQDEHTALLATAALSLSSPLLRLAPTEAMYVPALAALSAVALGTELLLRTRSLTWLLVLLPACSLTMQTRGDLLLMVPVAVLLRALLSDQALVLAWLRRPAVWVALGLAGASLLPRLLDVQRMTPPEDSGRPLVDFSRDPRTLALCGLLLLGLLAWPPLSRRLPGASARNVAISVAIGLAAALAWGWMWRSRSPGYDPSLHVHAWLDPRISAPWIPLWLLAGLAADRREDPQRYSWLCICLGGALLLYLPRYDCLSTYVATSLTTLPLMALGVARGQRALLARFGWPTLVAGALLADAAAVAWSAPWLRLDWPKEQQARLYHEALSSLPDGATVVWLAEEDAPDGARERGVHTLRYDLRRHTGDRLQVATLSQWRAGATPPEVWFLETVDCHRPLLSQRRPLVALLGAEERPYHLRRGTVADTAPRYAVDGLDPDVVWTDPLCAAALAQSGPPRLQATLEPHTSGSIWEEAHGLGVTIGLHPLNPPH